METNEKPIRKVSSILRSWKGSDAADQASPNDVAREIDRVYAEYLATLPSQAQSIGQSPREGERRAA